MERKADAIFGLETGLFTGVFDAIDTVFGSREILSMGIEPGLDSSTSYED